MGGGALSLSGQLGSGIGISLESFLRFWAVAARWNSSRAPFGPRSRSPSRRRMRLRWANNISIFLSCRRETSPSAVLAISRAMSRAPDRLSAALGGQVSLDSARLEFTGVVDAAPTDLQSGRSISANDPLAHVYRARSYRTACLVRLAVIPSSTQFLPQQD
jgi:hypothetical protein